MPDLRPPMRPVPAKPLIAPRVRSRIGGHRGPPDLESCMSHVEGKVAVVTGGAGGFGPLIRRMLAERGATAVRVPVADAGGCRTVEVRPADPPLGKECVRRCWSPWSPASYNNQH